MDKTKEQNISYGENIRFNIFQLQRIHDITCLLIGIVSGIMMLESLDGFAFFFTTMFSIDCYIYFMNGIGSQKKYFQNPVKEIFLMDYNRTTFGFIMMWTLFFRLMDP